MLTILFYHTFFLFFLSIDLYFLIPGVISQAFNPAGELLIPIEILTKEAIVEIYETRPVTAQAKISMYSM